MGTEPLAFCCHAVSENGQEGVFARKLVPRRQEAGDCSGARTLGVLLPCRK